MAALDVDFYILKNVFWQVRTHLNTNYGPFLLIHVDENLSNNNSQITLSVALSSSFCRTTT